MFRNLTIGSRLAGGFTGLVAFTIAVLALFYLVNSNKLIAEAENAKWKAFMLPPALK